MRLGVCVHKEDAFSRERERYTKVGYGGGFAYSALLVGDGDSPSHSLQPPFGYYLLNGCPITRERFISSIFHDKGSSGLLIAKNERKEEALHRHAMKGFSKGPPGVIKRIKA